MIHGNASHHIFEISELTRLIASQLIPISPKSAVNLACTCRYLEEPVLSTLWETQGSLNILLEVLAEDSLDYTHLMYHRKMVRDLGPLLEKSNAQV